MPNEKKTVWEALAAAMDMMDNPVKSKAVQAGARRYNYEVLADVLDIVKPALHANGLCLKQGVSMEEGQTVMQTGVGYGETVYVLDTLPITIPADPQAAGSAITYARRYGLKTSFGLAGVDDDGEAARNAVSKGSVSPSKAPSYAAPTKEPRRGRFEQIGLLKAKLEGYGFDTAPLAKDLANITGKADMKTYTDEDIAKAEQYLGGILENRKGGTDARY